MAVPARKQDVNKNDNSDPRTEPVQLAVAPFLGEKQRTLLRKGLCARLTDDQAEYFYEVVERTELDPFEGLIWPSIRKSKDEDGNYQPTMTVMVKLQGLRAIADRSGLFNGEDPVEWTGEDGVWKPEWLSKEPPIAARARCYRKDRDRPQVSVCRWDAYVQTVFDKGGNEVPNAIWKRFGSHMLGKCALAGGYRGLFPRLASGIYITEEMGQVVDPDSETAIEAEMLRRAAREANYWEAEKAKGHFPVGQGPSVLPPAIPLPEPQAEPPVEPLSQPIQAELINPRMDWRTFPITRIKLFNGRTIGSLTQSELKGLIPWLERVSNNWGGVDNDIRAHFTSINQRIEYDKAQPASFTLDSELEAGLQITP